MRQRCAMRGLRKRWDTRCCTRRTVLSGKVVSLYSLLVPGHGVLTRKRRQGWRMLHSANCWGRYRLLWMSWCILGIGRRGMTIMIFVLAISTLVSWRAGHGLGPTSVQMGVYVEGVL